MPIVIPRLKKVNAVGGDAVDGAMFLGDATAPASGQLESERLGFTEAAKWV